MACALRCDGFRLNLSLYCGCRLQRLNLYVFISYRNSIPASTGSDNQ
ncbi:MAG: hypothetical protein P8X74_00585 [Reinekea sp.]